MHMKMMHIGANHQQQPYMLMQSELVVIDQDRDLRIVVDSLRKMLAHCVAAVKMNSMLGIIRRQTENETTHIRMPLYKSMAGVSAPGDQVLLAPPNIQISMSKKHRGEAQSFKMCVGRFVVEQATNA